VSILRWGLLGTARVNRHLVPRLHAAERHELAGVASRDRARADAFAAEWKVPRAFGSYLDLLACPDIDAVYIPLPNALHAEWILRALDAGKHVLCEKPLVVSIGQMNAVHEAARRTGLTVAEGFMYRHHPVTHRARELVRSGAIGRPRVVHGSFTYWQSREPDVRLDSALDGGCLWDVGCYPLGYARYALGEEPVEAFTWTEVGPTGVDVAAAGQLQFPSGVVCQFDCGFRAAYRTVMVLAGTDGVLTIPNPFKPGNREWLELRRGDVVEPIGVDGPPAFAGELDDMANAVLDGRPPAISLDDSRGTLHALLACFESARTGRVEPVPPHGV
jgi:D-xylose 1-dehydrogenase (NADP+, D-xylono-1,5-lactone-forming)